MRESCFNPRCLCAAAAALLLVWTRGLAARSQQGTPLAYGGVLYMPNPRDVIQAIDAVTGDLLWEYRRERPDDLDDYVAAALSGQSGTSPSTVTGSSLARGSPS